jgi:hypothetical protein
MAAPSWSPGSLPGFPEKLQPSFTMVDSGPSPGPETETGSLPIGYSLDSHSSRPWSEERGLVPMFLRPESGWAVCGPAKGF